MTPVIDPLYALAEVHQASPSSAPVLSVGWLTVNIVQQFKNACHHYFSMKDVAADNRISKIIYNFESTSVQSWIMAEEIALPFPNFLVRLKKKFLPWTWEDKLIQDQIAIQGSLNLLTWVNKVHNVNDELKAAQSPYHIPKDHFHLHLLPHLSDGLKCFYKANNWVQQSVHSTQSRTLMTGWNVYTFWS